MPTEVVISGIGACGSMGDNVASCWQRVAYDEPPPPKNPIAESARDRAKRWALQASEEALCSAALWDPQQGLLIDAERVGCTVSASKPFLVEGAERPLIAIPPEVVTCDITARFGLRGETRNVIAACATGVYAVALGAQWIREGLCDVVVAGSVEPHTHPLYEAGFQRMGVLSGSPVMRPFDRRREGFVLGEGAGVVVLESEAHARRRAHVPWARLAGWALGADPHSAFAFNSGGERIADVMRRALRNAQRSPGEVGHVNAHGTGTRLNDALENLSLRSAFGRATDGLMISATKGRTGHLLGAAGSVELIWAILALKDQFIPPTAHLEERDPDCDLDYTAGKGHSAVFSSAMSLSYGFGGSIGALIVSH